MRATLFYLSLLCLPASAEAESWYQVEVIIFDRLYPDSAGEQWRDTPFILPDDPVEPRAALAGERLPYSLLPRARHRLGGIYNVLGRAPEYRPLLHLSWRQPAAEGRRASYVRLQHPPPDPTTAPAAAEPMFVEQLVRPERIIDGVIRIRGGFYLHADIDLSCFKPIPPENTLPPASATAEPAAIQKTRLALKETRKIKLDEIHYFDHPMYGLILQVSRLNPAAQ